MDGVTSSLGGKGNRIYNAREQSSALRATLRLTLGAGVTPAEGSVKPIAGFTFNKVPSRSAGLCRLLNGARYGSIACSGSIEVIIHLIN
jgi:hypothetical protein